MVRCINIMKITYQTYCICILCILLCLLTRSVHADEGEDTLGLYSSWQEHYVSAGRTAKPLSHTPENMTVVSSREIEALNAHTLADVLATTPGIQLENLSYFIQE